MNRDQIEKELKVVYDTLEEEIQLFDNFDLVSKLCAYSKNIQLNDIIRREIIFLEFNLVDGKLNGRYSSINREDNKEQEYPSTEQLDNEDLTYLQSRCNRCNSKILKIRYNQILYNSIYKDYKHARDAIDNYISLYNTTITAEDDISESIILSNCYPLSKIINHRKLEVIDLILIKLSKAGKVIDIDLLLLLESLSDQPKLEKEIIISSEAVVKSFFNHSIQKPDIYLGERLLPTAVKFAQRQGKNLKSVHTNMGKVCEAFGDFRKPSDDTGMIPLSMYNKAMRFYKLAGNKTQLKSVTLKFTEQKRRLRLGKLQIPINRRIQESIDNWIDDSVMNLFKYSTNEICDYLSYGSGIIPLLNKLNDSGRDTFVSEKIFTRIELDINQNIKETLGNYELDFSEDSIRLYNLDLSLFTLPYLEKLLTTGVSVGKLTYKSLTEYLMQFSWIGQNLEETNAGGEIRVYNWLVTLSPGLHSLFNEVRVGILTKKSYQPNYQLAIDSLVLKFEGMLRDLLKRSGIETTKSYRDGTREMNTEDLLREGSVKLTDYFNDNEIYLFHYLYTKHGANLRNNIAHCYLKQATNYSLGYALLVFFSILRLGKKSIGWSNLKDIND